MGVTRMGAKVTTEIRTTFGDTDRLHVNVTKKETHNGFMKVTDIALYDGTQYMMGLTTTGLAVLCDVMEAAYLYVNGTSNPTTED